MLLISWSRSTAPPPCTPHPVAQASNAHPFQLVSEHCSAFRHNNAIIRSFHIGWRPFLAGLLRLITFGKSPVAVAAVVALLAVLLWIVSKHTV